MGEVVARALGRKLDEVAEYGRRGSGDTVTRKPSASIPFGQVTLSAITQCLCR